MTRKRVILLGATGSIGESTLRVLRTHPEDLELVGLACRSNWRALAPLVKEFQVREVAFSDAEAYRQAKASGDFGAEVNLLSGEQGLVALVSECPADIVLVGISGTAGLMPTLAAIRSGKDIALASKEVLVLGGQFVMQAVKEQQVQLLPVDSEHNGGLQCLAAGKVSDLKRLILTASGGPFRNYTLAQMQNLTPKQALRHPNWKMGPKITIDSATMANKGLELIEAHWLFGLGKEALGVVVHPQSIVHALAEYVDGAVIAHLAPPSMTFPIQHALLYPRRAFSVDKPLDFTQAFKLDFEPPDKERFPCLDLALQCLASGGTAPALFNAANEVAVNAFIQRKLPFLGISQIIDKTLEHLHCPAPYTSLEDVLAIDAAARKLAIQCVENFSS